MASDRTIPAVETQWLSHGPIDPKHSLKDFDHGVLGLVLATLPNMVVAIYLNELLE